MCLTHTHTRTAHVGPVDGSLRAQLLLHGWLAEICLMSHVSCAGRMMTALVQQLHDARTFADACTLVGALCEVLKSKFVSSCERIMCDTTSMYG